MYGYELMTKDELTKKLNHYEWMLKNLKLNLDHEWWVETQIEDISYLLKKVSA
jgi:hypothetical protein